jgi:transposase
MKKYISKMKKTEVLFAKGLSYRQIAKILGHDQKQIWRWHKLYRGQLSTGKEKVANISQE